MTHKHITAQHIIDVASTSASMREASQRLNIPYETFINRAKRLGVYNPTQNPKGNEMSVARREHHNRRTLHPLNEILEGKHPTYRGTAALKEKLFAAGIKKNQCEECGQLPEWHGKILVLELDHVDGNPRNHHINNLRILCGHCHSQTPTFRGRKRI